MNHMQSWEAGPECLTPTQAPSSTQKRIWEAVYGIAWGGLSLLPHPARIWKSGKLLPCGEGRAPPPNTCPVWNSSNSPNFKLLGLESLMLTALQINPPADRDDSCEVGGGGCLQDITASSWQYWCSASLLQPLPLNLSEPLQGHMCSPAQKRASILTSSYTWKMKTEALPS